MTNTDLLFLPARDLEVGDYLPDDDCWVEEVHVVGDGVWVEFSDGDAGYCEPGSRFRVDRS